MESPRPAIMMLANLSQSPVGARTIDETRGDKTYGLQTPCAAIVKMLHSRYSLPSLRMLALINN